jgi:WD40 repeat protein
VAFSPDGQQLASASGDGTVKILDLATGKCLQIFKGHLRMISSVAFSPDGQQIASASSDSAIKIWDLATGICLQTFKGHGGVVCSVAFSPDGQQLASGSGDSVVKIWDLATGKCLQTFNGHKGGARSVAFSPDGHQLASASSDDTAKIWDLATGKCLQTIITGTFLAQISFDPTGSYLHTGTGRIEVDLSHRPRAIPPEASNADAVIATIVGGPSPNRQDRKQHGYGLSLDGSWITYNGQNTLWLPSEYRPSCTTILERFVCIGCQSGRVHIIGLSLDV